MSQRTVLIVEDDRWVADNHAEILQRAGFVVVCVASAEQAIESVDEVSPDVILLDFFLPEVNAMQVLHELQSYSDTADIPVVLCTSFSEARQNAEAFADYGVRFVFDKSTLTPKQLVAAVKDAIV